MTVSTRLAHSPSKLFRLKRRSPPLKAGEDDPPKRKTAGWSLSRFVCSLAMLPLKMLLSYRICNARMLCSLHLTSKHCARPSQWVDLACILEHMVCMAVHLALPWHRPFWLYAVLFQHIALQLTFKFAQHMQMRADTLYEYQRVSVQQIATMYWLFSVLLSCSLEILVETLAFDLYETRLYSGQPRMMSSPKLAAGTNCHLFQTEEDVEHDIEGPLTHDRREYPRLHACSMSDPHACCNIGRA